MESADSTASKSQILSDYSKWDPADLDAALRLEIPKFQWFVHVDFGNEVFARSTAWPDAPSDHPSMGIPKFEFIVRENLPNLQGKRILELGCNSGTTSIHMVRLGAREVVGIDSDRTWKDWLPQATMVKRALELRCDTTYNTRYIEMDMADLPNHDLGEFDAVVALNCLYYLEEADIERVLAHLSKITNHVLIQCNTQDQGHLGRRPHPEYMTDVVSKAGFQEVTVDKRWGPPRKGVVPRRYERPVVVGKKS